MKVRISEKKLINIIREAIEGAAVDKRQLAIFCLSNEFYFVADCGSMFDMRPRVANTENLQNVIASEVLSAKKLEFSHEADSYFKQIDPWAEGNCVVKVILDNEEYFILWER